MSTILFLLLILTCLVSSLKLGAPQLHQTQGHLASSFMPDLSHLVAVSASYSAQNPAPINPCSAAAPVYNGTHCSPCPPGTYYIYTIAGCYRPNIISNVAALGASNNILIINNITVATIATQNAALTTAGYPVVSCPPNFPLFDPHQSQCVVCKPGTFYLLSNLTCYVPHIFSNLTALYAVPNTLTVNGYSILNLFAHRISYAYPITYCPGNAPMFNGTQCIACNPPTYYLFLNRTCYTPSSCTNVNALRALGTFIDIGSYTLTAVQNNISSNPYPCTPCPSNTPIFDGLKCIACPAGTYYVIKNNTCYTPVTFTNVGALTTLNQVNPGTVIPYQGVTLTTITNQINTFPYPKQYCPTTTPLYNGVSCIACPTGTYYLLSTSACYLPQNATNTNAIGATNRYIQVNNWTLANIAAQIAAQPFPTTPCPSSTPLLSAGTCIPCPVGQYYDLKNSTCYSPGYGMNVPALIASGKYVNIGSNTISALNASIAANPFPQKPCPAATPLFIGGACIACPVGTYVLMTNFTCYQPKNVTNVTALNATHRYVNIGSYTLANIAHNISSSIYPYVQCSTSAPLFNGNQCLACPLPSYYDLKTLACINSTYVSNVNALNATNRVVQINPYNLSNLAAQISAIVLPIKLCPSSAPLWNGTHCQACPNGTWYLLKNLSCYTPHQVTNVAFLMKNHSYVNIGNHTITNLAVSIANNPYPVVPCPTTAPVFNGSSCAACPNGTFYLLNNYTCYTAKTVSNISAIYLGRQYINFQNYTLANLNASIFASALPVQPCPSSFPFFNQTHCVTCPNGTYYLFSNSSCYIPQNVTNVTALLVGHRYINHKNYTLASINASIAALKFPTLPCPTSAPLLNNTHCVACPNGTYYLFSNMSCYVPRFFSTNVGYLNHTGHYIIVGNYTLANLTANISLNPYPTLPCPPATPLYNGTACFACPSGTWYVLKNGSCHTPPLVSNVSALNATNHIMTYNNSTLAMLAALIAKIPYPVQACPASAPLYNGTHCMNCTNGTYYMLWNHSCYHPHMVTNITKMNITKLYIDVGPYTLTALAASISALNIPVKVCPTDKPFYNGTQCMECIPGYYYNLKFNNCQRPNYISNILALKTAGNYQQTGGSTLAALQSTNNLVPYPIKQCPNESPLFTGSVCIFCHPPSFFDLATKSCGNCQTNFQLNTTSHQCLPITQYYPNLNNVNWVVNNAIGLQLILNITAQRKTLTYSAMCPSATPNWNANNNSCGVCPSGQLWNYNTYVCETCPTGTFINYKSRTCSHHLYGVWETSLNAPNLIFNGISLAQYQSIQAKAAITYPGIAPCPSGTPYFDGFNCISCPPAFPFFSMQNQACTTCPAGSVYKANLQDCFNTLGIVHAYPNIGKMYSSVL